MNENYIVKTTYRIYNTLDSGKKVFFTVSDPTLENLKELERLHPGWFLRKHNGVIKSDSQGVDRKIAVFNMVCTKIEGFKTENPADVQELLKMQVANSILQFQAIPPADVEADFGPEYLVNVDDDNTIVYTTARQAGKSLCQAHIFTFPTIDQIREYDKISAMDQSIENSTIKFASKRTAEALSHLYDSLFIDSRGYQTEANDVLPSEMKTLIPALHKMTVIKALFERMNKELDNQSGNL
jgi:hypothetical protein